jgi:hypothetical protein
MLPKSLRLGGNGQTNMDTKSKSKEYWAGYERGLQSCRAWTDYHNPHPKDSKEHQDYYEGFDTALDDLVHAWGSTGC